jgi:hypothetical protein
MFEKRALRIFEPKRKKEVTGGWMDSGGGG